MVSEALKLPFYTATGATSKATCCMKPPFKSTKTVLLALLLSTPVVAVSQSSLSTLSLSARVSPAATVSAGRVLSTPDADPGVSVNLVQTTHNKLVAAVSTGPGADPLRARIELLLRSNVRFKLNARTLTATSTVNLTVVEARSTGPLVMPGALSSLSFSESPVQLSGSPVQIGEGSRVSRGGSSSRENAIELEVAIDVLSGGPGARQARVEFITEPAVF